MCTAGSTQEEMGALVQQSINDSKISGGDRPVAWDGETRRTSSSRYRTPRLVHLFPGPAVAVNTSSLLADKAVANCSVVDDVSLKACDIWHVTFCKH